uniref:Predicted gene, 61963 n=1 Tax=Mus musculus TaxID=10090 RepID=A0ABJ3HP57_MOUSE
MRMVKGTEKTHNLLQDVEPSTLTSKPKRVTICLITDIVPSTWTSEPKTWDTCLTPDLELSTSTAEPKTVICGHQSQSKCSKTIRRAKVPTM